jgi:hypothetical protein
MPRNNICDKINLNKCSENIHGMYNDVMKRQQPIHELTRSNFEWGQEIGSYGVLVYPLESPSAA